MTTGLFALRFALVLAGMAVGAAQAQTTYRCKDEKGGVVIQQTPCRDQTPAPPPPPPPKKLPCDLTTEQVRRASRLEIQFLTRFPDEAAHHNAEAADLQPVLERIRVTKGRLEELATQRKPLDKEAEFYRGKPMPSWLKNKLDAIEAQVAASTEILKNREQELVEIKARFQCQRDTFGKMWAGAAPGSSACNRPACAPP